MFFRLMLLVSLTLLSSFSFANDVSENDRRLLDECFTKLSAVESVFENEVETLEEAMEFGDKGRVVFAESLGICSKYLKVLKEVKGE